MKPHAPPPLPRARARARARGQAIVELALVLPVMLLLLLAATDLGRLFYVYVGVTNAAREGAAYGMAHPTDTTGIAAAARQEMGGDAALAVPSPSCDTACASSSGVPGNTITVTVTQPFTFITPIVPAVTLSASSTAVIQ